jgi:hypothetical protein
MMMTNTRDDAFQVESCVRREKKKEETEVSGAVQCVDRGRLARTSPACLNEVEHAMCVW